VFKARHIITIQSVCGAFLKIDVEYQCALVIFKEGVKPEGLIFRDSNLE
jgi:hypothetical protein